MKKNVGFLLIGLMVSTGVLANKISYGVITVPRLGHITYCNSNTTSCPNVIVDPIAQAGEAYFDTHAQTLVIASNTADQITIHFGSDNKGKDNICAAVNPITFQMTPEPLSYCIDRKNTSVLVTIHARYHPNNDWITLGLIESANWIGKSGGQHWQKIIFSGAQLTPDNAN